METTKYLNISADRFIAAYNNFLFIPGVSKKVELEYLSWSNANKLLNQFFPELIVEFERDEEGSFAHKIKTGLAEEVRDNIVDFIKEKQVQLDTITDWKAKAKLEEEIQTLLYDNRGWYVLPYLVDRESGLRTPSLFFPVMDHKNNAVMSPDARDINDTKARGGVKAIALYTGLGLRLYTREDIPPKGFIKDSPKWKRIVSILDSLEVLDREVDFNLVNLGRSEKQLEQLAYDLYFESEPLREAKKVKK
jgi:hypothetical protein